MQKHLFIIEYLINITLNKPSNKYELIMLVTRITINSCKNSQYKHRFFHIFTQYMERERGASGGLSNMK